MNFFKLFFYNNFLVESFTCFTHFYPLTATCIFVIVLSSNFFSYLSYHFSSSVCSILDRMLYNSILAVLQIWFVTGEVYVESGETPEYKEASSSFGYTLPVLAGRTVQRNEHEFYAGRSFLCILRDFHSLILPVYLCCLRICKFNVRWI